MQCEMCGAEFPRLKRVRVEGTVMSTCNGCARFGEEIAPPKPKVQSPETVADRLADRQRKAAPKNVLDQMEEELVDDFGDRIKRGREQKGWTRERLADRIHEPVPTVTKFEAGQMVPSDTTVRTLERELGIKLMEAVPRSQVPRTGAQPARGLTLGDLIKQAQEKKK